MTTAAEPLYMQHYVEHDVIHKTGSTNILHCHQKRIEPRPQVTRTENLVKCGRVVFEICGRTDRQTNRQTDTLIAIFRTLNIDRRHHTLDTLN